MTRFLLIRHAMNDAVGKRLAGRMDGVHLNGQGRAQAQELAGRLAGLSITAVYSSPLHRALETAAPLAASLRLETLVDKDLLEIDFGLWTNAAYEDLQKQLRFQRFNTFRSGTAIPGGEFMAEAQLRIVRSLNKLCDKHPGETVAAVSHADMIKAAIAYYAGIHLDMFHRIEISPASVSIVEIGPDTARILLVNHRGMIDA